MVFEFRGDGSKASGGDWGAPSFPSWSVYQLFCEAAERHSEKDFVVFKDKRISYRRMLSRVDKLAKEMSRYGVRCGGRVGVLLPNCPEFVEIYLAAQKLGAAFIPINTRIGIADLETILKNSEIQLLFYSPSIGGINTVLLLEELRFQLGKVERVFAILRDTLVFKQPFDDYESLFRKEEVEVPKASGAIVPEDDVALILHTAGTTGAPKGVMLTHRNVVWTALNEGSALKVDSGDRILSVSPFFHVFGAIAGITGVLAGGATLCIPDSLNAEAILHLIESERITVFEGAPAVFATELESPFFDRTDLSRLRLGMMGGAGCPPTLLARLRQKLGCDLAVSYGLTETSQALTVHIFDERLPREENSVGKVLPGIELKIVDPQDRRDLPSGRVGELACRGYAVMKSYFKRPDLTRTAFDDGGWFYTGDLAKMDRQGYVRIVGRKTSVGTAVKRARDFHQPH